MTFITVMVITAPCFIFFSTRKYGVISTGLLHFQLYYTVGVILVTRICELNSSFRKDVASLKRFMTNDKDKVPGRTLG